MKSRIQGTFLDAQRLLGEAFNGSSDSIAMQWPPAVKHSEDEQIERGLGGIRLGQMTYPVR